MTATVVLPRERVVVPDGPLAVPFDARGVADLFALDGDAGRTVWLLYGGGDAVAVPEQGITDLVDRGLVVEQRDGLHAVPLTEAIERGWKWREHEAELLFRTVQATAQQQWRDLTELDPTATFTEFKGELPELDARLYDVMLQARDIVNAFAAVQALAVRVDARHMAAPSVLVSRAAATCVRGVRSLTVFDTGRMQQLYQRRTNDAHAHLPHFDQRVGTVPMRIVVVDDRLTLIPSDPSRPYEGILFIESRPVAAYARELVERRIDGQALAISSGLERRRLVTLLAEGCTDEGIARRLGMSDRTVRRVVADLMREHGAQSRFQLALRLREAGVL